MRFAFLFVILVGALLPDVGSGQTKPESPSEKAMRLLSGLNDGQPCGGPAGLKCKAGTFCDMPAGACAGAEGQGHCVALMTTCFFTSDHPVCGCDRKTYRNNCLRQHARVSKAHDGKC